MDASTLSFPGVWSHRWGLPEEQTPVSELKPEPANWGAPSLPVVEEPPVDLNAVEFRTSSRGCVLTLPLGKEEEIFGFGLQLKSSRQTGKKRTIRVNSDPVADTGDSHAPAPFYVSTAGYAVLVDTARYATFYCGSHQPLSEVDEETDPSKMFSAEGIEVLYEWRRHEKRRMVVEIPVAKGVEVYVFAGPTFADAVRRYILFSGGGCLPPRWSLGPWYRTWGKHSQEGVLNQARRLRERDIPVSVFGFEPGWHQHAYSCNYRWHPDRFPEPESMLQQLVELELHPNLWEHAFVHPSAEMYGDLKPHAGDTAVWGGLIPDLTREEARSIFADYHEKSLVEKGVSGFKLDECDNSDYLSYPWSYPEYMDFPGGLDGEQMHSLFGVLFQQTIGGMFRNRDQRTLGQVRSSHALSAPHPFVLYSDLYDHKDFIRGVVTAGISGILWCPEVRQCLSAEDLIRRLQTTVFSPQALVNAWMIPHFPWEQFDAEKNRAGEKLEDWEELESVVRDLFQLRNRLVPYLYAAYADYHQSGTPPFRPLVYEHPEDPATFDIDDQYWMGSDLMVAPVVAGESERDLYLPEGSWYEFWSGKRMTSGWHRVEVPLHHIPVFVREGALLPLAVDGSTAHPEMYDLEVTAYGQNPGGCRLADDDGSTFAFERDASFPWVGLKWDTDAAEAVWAEEKPPARYRIVSSRSI